MEVFIEIWADKAIAFFAHAHHQCERIGRNFLLLGVFFPKNIAPIMYLVALKKNHPKFT
jgi:hypothetical protein